MLRTYNAKESVDRAYSRLGEDWYNVLLNNCEHFVTWCIFGFHSSSQVNKLILSVGKVAASQVKSQSIKKVANIAATNAIKSTISSSSGSLAGLATATGITSPGTIAGGTVAGLTTAAGVTSGASIATTVGVSSLTTVGASAFLPVIAVTAVGVGLGYGVKKLVDWIWD